MTTTSRVRAVAESTGDQERLGRLNAGHMEEGLLFCLDEIKHERRLATRMAALRWLIAKEAKKRPDLRQHIPARLLDDGDDTNS